MQELQRSIPVARWPRRSNMKVKDLGIGTYEDPLVISVKECRYVHPQLRRMMAGDETGEIILMCEGLVLCSAFDNLRETEKLRINLYVVRKDVEIFQKYFPLQISTSLITNRASTLFILVTTETLPEMRISILSENSCIDFAEFTAQKSTSEHELQNGRASIFRYHAALISEPKPVKKPKPPIKEHDLACTAERVCQICYVVLRSKNHILLPGHRNCFTCLDCIRTNTLKLLCPFCKKGSTREESH